MSEFDASDRQTEKAHKIMWICDIVTKNILFRHTFGSIGVTSRSLRNDFSFSKNLNSISAVCQYIMTKDGNAIIINNFHSIIISTLSSSVMLVFLIAAFSTSFSRILLTSLMMFVLIRTLKSITSIFVDRELKSSKMRVNHIIERTHKSCWY